MGIFDFLKGGHMDEQDDGYTSHADDPYWSDEDSDEDNEWIGPLAKRRDEECAANNTPYGHGQAHGRFHVDDMRRYWHQTGANSFQHCIEVSGKYWYGVMQEEEEFVRQGYTDHQSKVEFARGILSVLD